MWDNESGISGELNPDRRAAVAPITDVERGMTESYAVIATLYPWTFRMANLSSCIFIQPFTRDRLFTAFSFCRPIISRISVARQRELGQILLTVDTISQMYHQYWNAACNSSHTRKAGIRAGLSLRAILWVCGIVERDTPMQPGFSNPQSVNSFNTPHVLLNIVLVGNGDWVAD